MKKVLIALDYDQSATKVAELGFLLARKMGAEIHLLHVISNPVYYSSLAYSPITGYVGNPDLYPLPLDNEDGLEKATLHFLEQVKHTLGDETIKTMIKEGEASESILKAAKELHIDVLIMGSHSQKWLENIVMGSVTQEVLRHTTIPLFIVPTGKKD